MCLQTQWNINNKKIDSSDSVFVNNAKHSWETSIEISMGEKVVIYTGFGNICY